MKNLILLLTTVLITSIVSAQNWEDRLSIKEEMFKSNSNQEVKGEIGSLKVPENRNNPNSEDIEIHFVRLKSTNPNPQSPLVYLEGGPGASCTWQASRPGFLEGWLPYLELGDVILLDQRGTGQGEERVLYIWQKGIPSDVLTTAQAADKHFKAVRDEALKDFKNRKVDLNGYTTVQNANDINELRQALGYEKISLLGFSYGTHLGQTYLKYHGESAENAVLVGVEGLNHTYKLPSSMDIQFGKIALMANSDPTVSKDVPDLMALYNRVIEKLQKEPVVVKVNSLLTGEPMDIKVGVFGLNLIMRLDIGDASDIPVFPRLLYSIDQGDYSILTWFVQKRIAIAYGVQGMAATMDPASGLTLSRLSRLREEEKTSLFKNVVNPGMESEWPAPDLGDDFRTPLISDVRTLFMSGTLDFNTPPYQAEEVRWGFSNSNHIIVKNAGHEQILSHPEATSTIIKFLKGESVDNVALYHPKLEFIPVKGESKKVSHPSL